MLLGLYITVLGSCNYDSTSVELGHDEEVPPDIHATIRGIKKRIGVRHIAATSR